MSNDVVDMLDDLFAKKEKKTRVVRQITEEESERASIAVNRALETKSLMTFAITGGVGL